MDEGSESAVNALIGVTAQNVEGDLRKFATELQHRFSERTAQLVAERDFVSGLLDTVDAAIYVLDRDARIIGVNAEFEKLSGYTFAEVKGKTLLETVVPSDEAAAFNDYFARILASQAAQRREGSWVRKNGSRLWISSSKRVLRRDAGGDIETIICSAVDRTSQREAEEELNAERNFVTSLLETSAALVVVVNPEGQISRVNKAFAAARGESVHAIRGRSFWDLLPVDEVDAARRALVAIREGAVSGGHDSHLVHADGSRRVMEWVSGYLWDAYQQAECFVITGIDITEKQRAEEELQARGAELTELHRRYVASGLGVIVAHELKQPLSAIVNYAEAALREVEGEGIAAVRGDLEAIRTQAHRLAGVIQELSGFLGKNEGKVQPTALHEIINTALRLFEHEARRRGIRLVCDPLEPALPPVQVERIRIEHVLVNLLQNAAEAIVAAGKKNGKIMISASLNKVKAGHNAFACVSVQDNGPGFGAAKAERVFERFFTTKPNGVGMGLPISRALVEAQGGRLWLESSGRKGATAYFTLPLAL